MIINNEKRNLNQAKNKIPYIRINYRVLNKRYISLKSVCDIFGGVVDQLEIINEYEHHQKKINIMLVSSEKVFYIDIDDMIYIIKHQEEFKDHDDYYSILLMLKWWITVLDENVCSLNSKIKNLIYNVLKYIKEKGQVSKTELWRHYRSANKYERFIIIKHIESVIETVVDETSNAKKKPIIYKYIGS